MNLRRVVSLGIIAALLAACQQDDTPADPTRTPTPPILAASPTVDPILPTNDPYSGAAVGLSNPTQAGLAAEGEPEIPLPTRTPGQPQATLPVVITVADGLALRGTLFNPAYRPAPIVVLLPEERLDRSSWDALAARLQADGYAVLTVDLRGYGETGGRVDWSLAPADIQAVLELIKQLSGIDPARLTLVGSSISANLALRGCADVSYCHSVVLLSPGLDYRGLTAADAMARLGARPVLIIASQNDENNPGDSVALDGMATGAHQLILYPAAGHGMAMFTAEPATLDTIVNWIKATNPPG